MNAIQKCGIRTILIECACTAVVVYGIVWVCTPHRISGGLNSNRVDIIPITAEKQPEAIISWGAAPRTFDALSFSCRSIDHDKHEISIERYSVFLRAGAYGEDSQCVRVTIGELREGPYKILMRNDDGAMTEVGQIDAATFSKKSADVHKQ